MRSRCGVTAQCLRRQILAGDVTQRWLHMMDITFLTMESLILAQDERWRRASYMQVEREVNFG